MGMRSAIKPDAIGGETAPVAALRDELEDASHESELRASLNRALRALEKAKASQAELIGAVYRAVNDNLTALTFAPVAGPKRDHRKGAAETAIITFSDLQLGQVTPTYNTDVAEKRVQQYAAKVIRLTELQRASHPIRTAKLYLLGDIVEGEAIFPGQAHQVDSSLFAQTTLHGPRILTNFIRTLLTTFEKVEVVSVPGNHGDIGGASRRDYNPETNADRMLSTIVRLIFEAAGEKRVTFTIPDGYGRTSWYAVDTVGDVGFMLWHGHQARRTSSSSHLPFYKLVMGWRSGAIPEPFSVSICGHHHTPTMLTMNSVTHYINGTFASDADYAIERLAANSKAAQWLLFARPGRGVTASYLVRLDD
jgi:predicted phosphodiesterase